MTTRELERLDDLLLKFFESLETSDGALRDEVSHVRYEVQERFER